MNNLVSIIIPVFNAQNSIERCLDSVIEQKYENIEILVVDDGSTDNSNSIISDFQKKDSRIKLLTQHNSGVSAARNNGLAHATGSYCCFIDADDYVSSSYVEQLLAGMILFDADMSTCANYYEYSKGKWKQSSKLERKLLNQNEAFINFFSKHGMKTGPVSKLYKKAIIDEFDVRFDPRIRIAEDKLFNFMYLLHCEKVIYSSYPYYFYCYNDSSASHMRKKYNGLYDACLPFLALDEMEDKLPYNIEIRKAYYSFAAHIISRVTYRNDLLSSLSSKDIHILRKRIRYYQHKAGIKQYYDNFKNSVYGLTIVTLPFLAKYLSKKSWCI